MRYEKEGSVHSRKKYRWLLLCAIILILFFLIPFFLVGNRIETWANSFIQSASSRPRVTATVLSLLLASDILIPVPANEANTAAGFFLGFTGGLAISLIGRIIGCMIGFWLGVKFGRPIARRLVRDNELKRLEKMHQRFGDWLIIILRPVPMLAEASVLLAGISKMPAYRFLFLVTLSNLGVSAVFSAVGAFSATVNSFVLAFTTCILISLIAMVIMKKGGRIKPKLQTELSTVQKKTTSEWVGAKGKIGAWFLNSSLRRLGQILILGDRDSAFVNEFSHIIQGDEVVLDVGAGAGRFSLAMAKKLETGRVICLDLSEEMLQRLERNAKKKGLKDRIQILRGKASSSGLENESVDLVVCNDVLHELSGLEPVLGEILRVLKPNGKTIITDFRDTRIGRLIGRFHGEEAHGPFSVNELEILLTHNGLNDVKVSLLKHWVIGVGRK